MFRLIVISSLFLTLNIEAMAGALPAEPVPVSELAESPPVRDHPASPHDKWLRIGLIWGATALDLASTRYALTNNPTAHESNPLLSTSNGGFRTGLYLGVSVPLDSITTYVNLKYPHSRGLRILTYVTGCAKIGIGVRNFRQVR